MDALADVMDCMRPKVNSRPPRAQDSSHNALAQTKSDSHAEGRHASIGHRACER